MSALKLDCERMSAMDGAPALVLAAAIEAGGSSRLSSSEERDSSASQKEEGDAFNSRLTVMESHYVTIIDGLCSLGLSELAILICGRGWGARLASLGIPFHLKYCGDWILALEYFMSFSLIKLVGTSYSRDEI